MAQDRDRSGGEDGGHPYGLGGTDAMPDRVDAALHALEPAALEPMADRTSAEPGRRELRARHDSMLSLGDVGDRPVHRRTL
jgi:hypothetical protein